MSNLDDWKEKDDFEDWYKNYSEEVWKDIKNNSKKNELLETVKYRKKCSIEKVAKVLNSSIVYLYDTIDLGTMQRMVILQLMRRIYECEEEIPRNLWCRECERKEDRIHDLIKRFQKMKKSKSKDRYEGKSHF
jgi:hypothetical protein